MALLLIVGVLFTAVDCATWVDHKLCGIYTAPASPVTRIFKGDPVRIGEFPWTVFIRGTRPKTESESFDSAFCTGAILDKRWILTAQHCVPLCDGYSDITIIWGRVNATDREYGGVLKFGYGEVGVNCFSPGGHGEQGKNDVMLMYINGPDELPLYKKNWRIVNRVCLIPPNGPFEYKEGSSVTVAAYGTKRPNQKRPFYRHTYLTQYTGNIMNSWNCRANYFWEFSTDAEFCYVNLEPPRPHACYGDSGAAVVAYLDEKKENVPSGAALKRAYAVGVVSGGIRSTHECGELRKGLIFRTFEQDKSPKLAKYINWIFYVTTAVNSRLDRTKPGDTEDDLSEIFQYT